MRVAAGIMMIVFGMTMMGTFVVALSEGGIHDYDLPFILFVIISAVFVITGGVFCLKRKYWKLCFTSSLFLSLSDFLFVCSPSIHLVSPPLRDSLVDICLSQEKGVAKLTTLLKGFGGNRE